MRRGSISPVFYLVPAAALIAVVPLILHGCSCGHDFDFHIVSWMEAAAQFKAGNLHPAWAFSPAWNAGEPRFVFYPPLSWTLGALLGLLLPWAAAPIVYTWIALVASGFAMYCLARTIYASPHASLIASIIYLVNPYMLFTAYERTAYAELLAAAWIPLLLAALLRERISVLGIAIPVALLWLTNAPAAVMGCYALAALAAMRVFWLWSEHCKNSPAEVAKTIARLAGRIVGGLALGLGLAAFYILPAAYERRWVQIAMATVEGMRIEDNFLFHHTADAAHDEVLHTASLIALFILLAAVVLFAVVLLRLTRLRNGGSNSAPNSRQSAISLTALALSIAFLLTPASAIVWRFAPEMNFLQFPWRLTALLAAILCAGLALALARLTLPTALLGIFAVVAVPFLIWPSVSAFAQACDDEDTVAARLAVFNQQMGTDPTDEYTTESADNDALGHADPPFWRSEDGDTAAPVSGELPGPAPLPHLSINVPHNSVLVLNLRDYPAWQVLIDHHEATQRIERADGLIAVPVHGGKLEIDISYVMTWDRELGDGLTLLALCIGVPVSFRRWRGVPVQPVL